VEQVSGERAVAAPQSSADKSEAVTLPDEEAAAVVDEVSTQLQRN